MKKLFVIALVLSAAGCGVQQNYSGDVKVQSTNGTVTSVEVRFPGATNSHTVRNKEEADRLIAQVESMLTALKSARDQIPPPTPAK
jgi:hypothetical protein